MAHGYERPFRYCLVVYTLIGVLCVIRFANFPKHTLLPASSTGLSSQRPGSLPHPTRFNYESSADSWKIRATNSASGIGLKIASTCTRSSLLRTSHETCRGRKLEAGYVLALTNWEQTVAGAASLQCWAATLNMVVVEPFLDKSYYNIPNEILLPNTSTVSNLIQLDDVYDIQYWNDYSKRNCYSPLVGWDEFICHAPKRVIIVHIMYGANNWSQHCPLSAKYTKIFTRKYSAFFSAHNFTTVRQVCLATNRARMLTKEEINSFILGPNQSSKTTVFINQWRGLSGSTNRVSIKDFNTACYFSKFYSMEFALPSTKFMEDATQYQERFLGGQDYTAVMLRVEFAYREMKGNFSTHCLKDELYSLITDLTVNQNLTNKMFWSLDIGKFGSYTYEHVKLDLKPERFFDEVFKVIAERYNVSYSEVEDNLFRVSGETNTGYIAHLQANIAVRAKCLLLVGGGTFHGYVEGMYEKLHQKMPHCIKKEDSGWLRKHCTPVN